MELTSRRFSFRVLVSLTLIKRWEFLLPFFCPTESVFHQSSKVQLRVLKILTDFNKLNLDMSIMSFIFVSSIYYNGNGLPNRPILCTRDKPLLLKDNTLNQYVLLMSTYSNKLTRVRSRESTSTRSISLHDFTTS